MGPQRALGHWVVQIFRLKFTSLTNLDARRCFDALDAMGRLGGSRFKSFFPGSNQFSRCSTVVPDSYGSNNAKTTEEFTEPYLLMNLPLGSFA